MSDTNDIVDRLRAVLHNDKSVELMNAEAADEIDQLRADLAQRTAEVAEAWLTNATLRADLARAEADRDEARREACLYEARYYDERDGVGTPTERHIRATARRIAVVREWNCFDAPHTNATDVPVRDGGAA